MMDLAIGQDKFIALNGLRFHYLDYGNADAPPLILLHGLTSTAHSWDKFAGEMRDRFHIVALDQRGHGETEWASDYSIERMIEDVDAFARTLRLSRFALVGLSMGGRNAYAYAAQHPQTVERLAIIDIGPDIPVAGAQRIRDYLMLASDVFNDAEEAFQRLRATNPYASDEDMRYRLKFNLIQSPDGKWTWRCDKALRSRPLPDPETSWAWLPKITCPTLIVRGAASDLLSRETAERMARVIPNCKSVEVAQSGHVVPMDNPSGFLTAVRPFLLGMN